ncbi:hypothetical protein [Flavobacterium sp.]|uniref:hypothetical protein n=1 Tax=Flavobacterium sp. TaxID=239 RepID=UPI00286E70FD|nr:hypothetical protein [Flavobacterium sp.]
MVFEVTQSLAITMNGFQTTLKTRFNVEFLSLNKAEDKRVFGIKKNKAPSISIADNNYLEVLEELELQTYPIEIETDLEGNFLRILNHKKWLKDWEQKTATIPDGYEDSENVKDIRNKYYEVIKDEAKFVESKFKEPFWNLLFFNPPIDSENDPEIGTSLNWNLKSIGSTKCTGRTQLKNSTDEEVIIYFESKQKLSDDIVEKLKSKTGIIDLNWEDRKVNLQVGATFNTVEKKIKSKKALFELVIDGIFSYAEETIINFKKSED